MSQEADSHDAWLASLEDDQPEPDTTAGKPVVWVDGVGLVSKDSVPVPELTPLSEEASRALEAGLQSAREAIDSGTPFSNLGSFREYADDEDPSK